MAAPSGYKAVKNRAGTQSFCIGFMIYRTGPGFYADTHADTHADTCACCESEK
jgi:hypothetical protein